MLRLNVSIVWNTFRWALHFNANITSLPRLDFPWLMNMHWFCSEWCINDRPEVDGYEFCIRLPVNGVNCFHFVSPPLPFLPEFDRWPIPPCHWWHTLLCSQRQLSPLLAPPPISSPSFPQSGSSGTPFWKWLDRPWSLFYSHLKNFTAILDCFSNVVAKPLHSFSNWMWANMKPAKC